MTIKYKLSRNYVLLVQSALRLKNVQTKKKVETGIKKTVTQEE